MSSAKGAYQMIDSTFAGQFRKQYPDRARGMSDQDIIALKRSPEGAALSEAMGPKLIESNARIIERGGFEPDAGNVYLAHFLGPDTAVKVLRADPNAPIANYVTEGAIMANPPLQKNPTVGGVIDWARGSMAKQAARLSRASGGLAGRNGYAEGGSEEDTDMAFRRSLEEDAAKAREDAAKVEQATPTGVAPPQAAAPAPAQAAPEDNNFFRGIAKGKATSIIPLLAGIGAMGTARTVNPFVAAAAGLGAGAQAAQAQRGFDVEKRKTAATEMQARATEMQAKNGALEAKAAWQNAQTGNFNARTTWLKDAQPLAITLRSLGNPDLQLEALINQMRSSVGEANKQGLNYNLNSPPLAGAAAPGLTVPTTPGPAAPVKPATPAPPAASGPAAPVTPTAPGPVAPKTEAGGTGDLPVYEPKSFPVPDMKDPVALRKAGYGVISFNQALGQSYLDRADAIDPPGATGRPKEIAAVAEANFGAEQIGRLVGGLSALDEALVSLNNFDATLSGMKNREAWQGPFAQSMVPILNFGNNVSAILQGPDKPPLFDTSGPAAIESATTDANRMVTQLTNAFSGTAGAEVMSNFASSNPTALNSPEGTRKMIATIRQANRAAHKQAEFARSFSGSPYDLKLEFAKRYPATYWVKRGTLDYQMSDPKNKALADMIRQQPDMNFKMPGRNETAREYYDKHLKSIGGSQTVLDVLSSR